MPVKIPVTIEDLAPWRSPLSRALHRNRAVPFCRYFQLATLRRDGTPANRTVVFRGFLSDTNQLMMISDRRSKKTEQLQQNPSAEACWYFTKTREQFRLSGAITVVTASSTHAELTQARERIWQNISDSARVQFAWPHPKVSQADSEAFSPEPPDTQTPPNTFTLLLLTVQNVDHLELRGDPQSRHLYTKDDSDLWQTALVNP